ALRRLRHALCPYTTLFRSSVMDTECSTPLLPRKLNRNKAPSTCTCLLRRVVNPKERFARAYSSLPTRISVLSSSRTTVARIWRRSEEHTSELQSRFDLVCR